jgi:hypothetical protein
VTTDGGAGISFMDDPDLAWAWELALEADLSPGRWHCPTLQHSYVSCSRSLLRGLDCDLDRVMAVNIKAVTAARASRRARRRGSRRSRGAPGDPGAGAGRALGGPATMARLCVLALPAVMDAERRGTLDALRADLAAGDPWTRTPPGHPYSPAWAVPAT